MAISFELDSPQRRTDYAQCASRNRPRLPRRTIVLSPPERKPVHNRFLRITELLHFVDDQLVDPDLGDRQHVVLARLQPVEVLFEPFLHPLDALA
jgi:hypothetical protein